LTVPVQNACLNVVLSKDAYLSEPQDLLQNLTESIKNCITDFNGY